MGKFEENFSLKKLNTFGINAKAKFFTEFDSVLELKDILNSNIYKNNKIFILGGGSNILLTQDYDGLIMQHKIIGICILEDNDNNIIVACKKIPALSMVTEPTAAVVDDKSLIRHNC